MFGKVYYFVTGLNFNKFLTLLKKENIPICKLQRLDYNYFCVGVKKQHEKFFLETCKKMNYTVSIKTQTTLPKTLSILKRNIALFISMVLVLIILVFSSNIVFKVEVFGLENVSKAEVIKVLNNSGYSTGKLKHSYNLNKLETVLKQNINNISFASAIIKGNTLLINVNEKIDNSNLIYDYKPIVSPYNLIVREINLKSGTAVVYKGQSVKQGEVLVLPYIEGSDGSQLKVEASAEIVADIELSNTQKYQENHTEMVRSGKRDEQTQLSLFNINLGMRGSKPNFLNYQTESTTSYYFKNFFVPIKQTKIYYYELIEKQVYTPFNKVVQNIIEQNKNILYNNLSVKKVNEINYETTTSVVDNIYYVTTYLKANVIL